MAIPKDILDVERPRNTFVVAYGKNKNLYAVRKYIGCRYDKGRRIPVKGPTVGHIRDGKYISTEEEPRDAMPKIDLKDWANVELCDKLFLPVLDELKIHYPERDANTLYTIAILRVCYQGVNDYELAERYAESFLSELHPGVALSRNTVVEFHKRTGRECSRIFAFMRDRAERICANAHILVDGTLKSNESRINSLSDFSRKARTKGSRDISVIYAFDLDRNEPVCSWCYPGNMLDMTAFEDFISRCGVKRGVLVSDKGLPSSATEKYRSENKDLHQLNPIRRNAKYIVTHDLYSYDGVLPGRDGVTFKKARINGDGKWLYSFRDSSLAALEERTYLDKAKSENSYSHSDFVARRDSFGTIVLECDLDLDPAVAYRMYEERWEIEIVMRYYKSACQFDETRVHSDYSVIGSEFCDFLATILTFKLIKEFDRHNLLKKSNYSRLMHLLRRGKKVRVNNGEWQMVQTTKFVGELIDKVGLTTQV